MPQATVVNAASAGAMVQLADSTLGVDTPSFDFTGIPGTYNHLRLILSVRSDKGAVNNDTLGIRFNNDSGANYQTQSVQSVSSTPAAQQFIGVGYGAVLVNAATSPANGFSPVTVDIPDYANTSRLKGFQVTGGYQAGAGSGQTIQYTGMGFWSATPAAINRITILPVGGGSNLVAGSRATLYGLL